MLTRRIKTQVIAFVVVALAATTFVGASYAGLGRLLGTGRRGRRGSGGRVALRRPRPVLRGEARGGRAVGRNGACDHRDEARKDQHGHACGHGPPPPRPHRSPTVSARPL